jgi:hypothetical protein
MHLPNTPAPRNRMLCALLGRIRQSLHGLAKVVRTLHHTMQKLRTHPITVRSMIHFALSQLSRGLRWRVPGLPLGLERLNKKITGLVGTATGNRQLPAVFIDDATRGILFPATAVVIARLVSAPSPTAARQLPNGHRRFTIDAQALAPSRGRGVGLLVLRWAKIASVALSFFCGWALTTWRRRKPRRFTTAAIVEGAGSWASL